MTVAEFLSANAQAGTMLSFVYEGGRNPGTRRTVSFIEPHQLRSGAQGFRAEHEGRPKSYECSRCSGMQLADAASDSDATDEEQQSLRAENASLKRQLDAANAEVAALKKMRAEVAGLVAPAASAAQPQPLFDM